MAIGIQHRINYIDPLLGERVLIVFGEEAHHEHLARLKKLGYEITHPLTARDARSSQEEAP